MFKVGQVIYAKETCKMDNSPRRTWIIKGKGYIVNQVDTNNGKIRFASEISNIHYSSNPKIYFRTIEHLNNLIRVL